MGDHEQQKTGKKRTSERSVGAIGRPCSPSPPFPRRGTCLSSSGPCAKLHRSPNLQPPDFHLCRSVFFLRGGVRSMSAFFNSLVQFLPLRLQYQKTEFGKTRHASSTPPFRAPLQAPFLPQADARLGVLRVAPEGSGRWTSSPAAAPRAVAAPSSALSIASRCIFELLLPLPLLLRSCSSQRQLREERVHSLFSPATGSDSLKALSAGAELDQTRKSRERAEERERETHSRDAESAIL